MAPSAVGTAFPKGHLCSSREGDTLGHLNPPRRPPPAGLRPDTEAQGQLLQLNQQGVGLDCSGLTQYCYRQAGISIPRNTESQYAQGKKLSLSEVQPGDILYRTGHVGIYIGGDRYIHAPHRGEVVKIASGISSFTCALSYR